MSVVRMSREDFEALPELLHTERCDEACVVSGTTNRHGRVTLKLGAAQLGAVQDRALEVGTGTGWRLPNAEFAPDIVVAGPAPDDELP